MITRAHLSSPPRSSDPRIRVVAWLVAALTVAIAVILRPAWALLFAGGAAASWALAPVVARLALYRNVTVLPGGRSIHSERTPLLGGVAIFVPFVLFLVAAGDAASWGLALGAGLMVGMGIYDDLRGLTPRVKVAAQIAAALILFGTGFRAPALDFAPFGSVATTGFEVLVVVFWVVLVTNAINLIDGMDGLAPTMALVAALACAVLGLSAPAALVFGGAVLGFLRHNLPQARIFLGDAGSLMLGFVVAAFLLNGTGPVNVAQALGIVALPLGDVALSTVRRWLRGKPIFTADKGHVHHRLLEIWRHPGAVLAGLAGLATAFATATGLFPDARGLAGVCLLWLGSLLYLLAKARPRWTRILLHRKSFRRLHLVRLYANEALHLAEDRTEVEAVIHRVAEDLRLNSLSLRGIRVERPGPRAGIQVEEHVDCGDSTASWSAAFLPSDPVLAEEKRSILCDLLRQADARLTALGPIPAPVATAPVREAAPPPPAHARPRVHFIVDSRERLHRVSPFVRETQRRGTLDPLVIHTGRRDDLGLTSAQMRELGLEVPHLDLDVAPGGGVVHTARVMERYRDCLGTADGRPAVVVVGDSGAAVACAMAAKECGLAVAHVGAATPPAEPLNRTLTASLADLTLFAEDRGQRPGTGAGQLLFLDEARGRVDADAARVVPALEALLLAGS
ncbi:MAG: glycosyltransferase family 4 protein [Planctomycetota bacterium]|jgi:UDP-GlcNAc:undecaprenyl-phosphate GlcNAc-1-phosphate transferase